MLVCWFCDLNYVGTLFYADMVGRHYGDRDLHGGRAAGAGRRHPPPRRQKTWCILESKCAALVVAVFVDFPKNKCNFLHKNKLDIVRRVQFLTGRRPMRRFSPEAVATIALWKSAPVLHCNSIARAKPVKPCGPVVPGSPVPPVAPCGPDGPGCPAGPLGPVAPAGPWSPVATVCIHNIMV